MTAAGGSLEDCHTNTFVFADLNGLKWKCLKQSSHNANVESLEDDLVLCAYGECLKRDLLCTWRRRPRTGSADAIFDNPAPRIDSPKELWIFWYSAEEPLYVTSLQENGLSVDTEYEGCEFGVNYETRVIFFKALHHIIERIHLRNGYVRFGKFFVRLMDMPAVDAERTLPEYVTASSYEFSLLGESLVVVTVCVQRQPTVLRLSACHLESGRRQPLILGPWAMRAVLLPDQPNYGGRKLETLFKTDKNGCQNGLVMPSLAEVQAVVKQEWKKWKRFQAIPADEDEDEEDDDDDEEEEEDQNTSSTNLPKMVLVDIAGVQMLYPTCFIGVLASEMDFKSIGKCRASVKTVGLLSRRDDSSATLCAEDQEVEDIFCAATSTTNPPTNISKTPTRKSISSAVLSHCRRSFDGVRAARRSFEDGCLSILFNRRTEADSNVALNGASSSVGAFNDAETTRWNFFDYLRREYCYCKLCTTTNSAMETDNSNSHQFLTENNHVFHRSPVGHVESVTPDHSPTFADELKALCLHAKSHQHESGKDLCGASSASSTSSSASSTMDSRSAWATGVTIRPGIIGGRLELDRSASGGGFMASTSAAADEADIFNVLLNHKDFNAGEKSSNSLCSTALLPPRIISPFTPIGAISPSSLDDGSDTEMDRTDPELQQRLRDFDYNYNPLIRDNFTQRSYHIVGTEVRRQRSVGPPPRNIHLRRTRSGQEIGLQNCEYAATTSTASSATLKAKPQKAEQTSILKSLLDDSVSKSPSPTNPRSTSNNSDSGLDTSEESSSHVREAKRRKFDVALIDDEIKSTENCDFMYDEVINPTFFTLDVEEPHAVLFSDEESREVHCSEKTIKHAMRVQQQQRVFGKGVDEFDMPENDGILIATSLIASTSSDSGGIVTNLQDPMEVDIQQRMSQEGQLNKIKADNNDATKAENNDVLMDVMAETPPALLNQFDDCASTSSTFNDGENVRDNAQKLANDGHSSDDVGKSRNHLLGSKSMKGSFEGHRTENFDPSSHYHLLSSGQVVPSVASTDQILSPPASNERVEFLGLLSSSTNSFPNNQQVTLYSSLNAGPIAHDSLSIIYPTPPTPMQQFSPQNAVVNAATQLATVCAAAAAAMASMTTTVTASTLPFAVTNSYSHPQLKHTLTEPALLTQKGEGDIDKLLPNLPEVGEALYGWESKLYEFPQSSSLTSNLLKRDNSADDSRSKRSSLPITITKALPTYNGRMGDSGKKRSVTFASSVFDSVPLLKTATGPKSYAFLLRGISETTMMNVDRELAMRLESSELKLGNAMVGACGMYGNNNGGMPPPSYPMNGALPNVMGAGLRNPNYQNYMAQQHFPINYFPSDMNAMMMARGGGMMSPNFRSNNMITMQQQQQYMQQQMFNNQMQRGGLMQQSPNFTNGGMNANNNNLPFSNRQQQFEQSNNVGGGIFEKASQQQMMSGKQQLNENFLLNTQQPIINQFGNSQMMNNSGGSMGHNTNTFGSEMEDASGYAAPPFGSPKLQQQQYSQTLQRVASNSSAQHSNNASAVLNGAASVSAMDYHLSSVSSTTSTMGGCGAIVATNAASTSKALLPSSPMNSPVPVGKLFSKMSMEAVANMLQRGNSFVIVILLRDTVLDLHFDSVFDGCPICCCNVNIRTFDLGLYIHASDDVSRCDEISAKKQQNSRFMPNFWSGFETSDSGNCKCNCGFSAIRHRYLCGGIAGLFPDDSIEACGVRPPTKRVSLTDNAMKPEMGRLLWFNPNQQSDRELLDLLRYLSLGHDFSATIQSCYFFGSSDGMPDTLAKLQKVSLDATQPSDYIVSRVDSIEMDKIMADVLDAAIFSENDESDVQRNENSIHHNWGVQISNEVREPKDSEYIATIREVQPLLEEAMRKSRNGVSSQTIKKLEGPLTWRSFILKTSKVHTQQQEDEVCQVEPIPNVIVATEREPIMTSPQLVSMWEKLSLSPYDQTKDVLYLAVAPDSPLIVEKCRIFMEELSSVYSDCRFGYHGRVNLNLKELPRDGIFRLSCSSMNNSNSSNISANTNFLAGFEEQYLNDRKVAMSRLKGYTDNFENEMLRFFTAQDVVFNRRTLYESLHRNKHQQTSTSLANSDTDRMPPPPAPQSPNSVLSSASGPSSASLLQMSQSISPNAQIQRQQQQISPAAGPNSAPSSSNMLEDLTPDGVATGISGQQQQYCQQRPEQEQIINEATLEKEVEESLSTDNPTHLPHIIVIYLINPFSFGSDADHLVFARVAIAALLRAYNSFVRQIDVRRRPQIQLEIVNLQSLYDYAAFCTDPLHEDRQNISLVENNNRDKMSARDCLRKIAFTVYSQPRVLLAEHMRGMMTKSMTRFGQASAFGDILDDLKMKPFPKFFKIQSCPFILSPTKSIGIFTSKDGSVINPTINASTNSKLQIVSNEERVLFVSYCLLGDEWLCAAVTDEHGHLLDNVLINLVAQAPPPQNAGSSGAVAWKYANESQIFDSIQRLWHYIQSILVCDTRNWRLVIGRIGKLGHGEFKAWTETLSKKNLRAYNNSLKKTETKSELGKPNGCKACSQIPGYQEMPAIFSACLISTEPELHLRVFPSSLQSEGNTNSNLFTASAGSGTGGGGTSGTSSQKNSKSKSSPQNPSTSAVMAYDPSVTHIMVFPTILNISFEPQTQANEDNFDFENLLKDGKMTEDDEQLGELMNLDFVDTKNDEETSIDNQPMATGYYISTAPALDMPEWFWSACPSARRRSLVHLKNSLHIHTGNIQQSDEIAALGAAVDVHHPLDSTATDEVLKYVLEKYNALSWMNVDFATGARLSCLPIHVQALLRLYKTVSTFFS